MARKRFPLLILVCTMIMSLVLPGLTWSTNEKNTQEEAKPPFYPSLINTHTGKPVKSTEFTSPDICSGCHVEIYKQWIPHGSGLLYSLHRIHQVYSDSRSYR